MELLQGEVLKQYAQDRKINVSRLARELGVERTRVYALYRTDRFNDKTWNTIKTVYPDFEKYQTDLIHRNKNGVMPETPNHQPTNATLGELSPTKTVIELEKIIEHKDKMIEQLQDTVATLTDMLKSTQAAKAAVPKKAHGVGTN